jgi:tRNA G18 (ribose-2'-O)-methylase SpoU
MATIQLRHITNFDAPELQPYATMKRPLEHERQGIFVAEGTKVSRRLLESRFPVLSVVLPEKWLAEFTPLIAVRPEVQIPVYLADKKLLEQLVGFSMFQGVMAVGRIPAPHSLDSILALSNSPRLLVAIDALTNAENLGTLVRNCVAFHTDALIVGETCGSPFLRRSVRNSMGTIFQLPIADVANLAQTISELRRLGMRCVAAHPHATGRTPAAVDFNGDCCLVFGSEGLGIRDEVLAACDEAVAIPMPPTVDSLNVGAAAAVFLYEVNRQRKHWADSPAG